MKKTSLFPFLVIVLTMTACASQATQPQTPPIATEAPPLLTEAPATLPQTDSEAEASSHAWKEIRDLRFGIGLAVPCSWIVTPMPPEGFISSMGLRNYDDAFLAANSEKGTWKNGIAPQGVVAMDITAVTGIDPNLTMVESYMQFVDTTTSAFVSSEEKQIGNHVMTLITLQNLLNPSEPNTTVYLAGLAPDAILIFNTSPAEAINSSDIQAILSSFAGVQDEPVTMPTVEPSSALTDSTCQ